MTRKEAYEKIKEYGLAETIKANYGCNYVNLTTPTLIEEIEDYEFSLDEPEEIDCCRLQALIDMLYKKHILCTAEYNELMN